MEAQVGRLYDRFAPAYDEWNAENDYEMWLGEVLLPELEAHGLRKGWALDVGCGTGRAFEPLMARGWQVVGCDNSAGMLDQARRKFGSRVRLHAADARDLPELRPSTGSPPEDFSLVLLLNAVANYFLEDEELEAVFAGIRRNLDPDRGIFVFDVNTLLLYRDDYRAGVVEEAGGWEWTGLTDRVEPGGIFDARLSADGVESHLHRQRHWTSEQVEAALEKAGCRALAVWGQREGAGRVHLSAPPDEKRDNKIIFVAAPTAARA